jgi:hypothetical protein
VKAKLVSGTVEYTGEQLRSHWIMERFGIVGDAVVAFVGRCHVTGEHLVDVEDFRLGNIVQGDRMLHFIAELFGVDLIGAVFAQRLLCVVAREVMNSEVGTSAVWRSGDDLYVDDGKLSVSVATVSPVSALIHMGLNVTTEGVPVKASCLGDLGLDHDRIAGAVLSGFVEEMDSCREASRKVKPVM